jgi:hypothetical protein
MVCHGIQIMIKNAIQKCAFQRVNHIFPEDGNIEGMILNSLTNDLIMPLNSSLFPLSIGISMRVTCMLLAHFALNIEYHIITDVEQEKRNSRLIEWERAMGTAASTGLYMREWESRRQGSASVNLENSKECFCQ